ncbi:cell wall anchor protein [Nocardiopsis rhodophaea]
MSVAQLWLLVGLGALHGVNPAMGWLLATARGLQEHRRAAVLGALPALAAGHAASIALVAVVITVTGSLIVSRWFPAVGGALVVAAGLWVLLARHSFHWRDVRMSLWQLTGWSFLMASMHGAGLMLLPVLAGNIGEGHASDHGHGGHAAPSGQAHLPADDTAPADPGPPDAGAASDAIAAGGGWSLVDLTLLGVFATVVHTAAMFVAAAVTALIAYDFLGVQAMRLRWVTLDRVWAFTLIVGGVFVLWTAM